MRFDWKPESKERYFRKAEAAVKAAGFDEETERHADGGRQRERLRICMKYLRQKTSSAGNTRAFSFTPT